MWLSVGVLVLLHLVAVAFWLVKAFEKPKRGFVEDAKKLK